MKIKKIALVLSLAITASSLFANDIEKNNSAFKKWGKEYKVGEDTLKELALFYTEGEEKYSFVDNFSGEEFVGIMGTGSGILKFGIKELDFIRGKTKEALRDPSTSIRISAVLMRRCLKSYGKTLRAIRCYDEIIGVDSAKKILSGVPDIEEYKRTQEENTTPTTEHHDH